MSVGNVTTDSGFRAARTILHPNIGTFKVEGNCLGMAMTRLDYRAKAKTGAVLPSPTSTAKETRALEG